MKTKLKTTKTKKGLGFTLVELIGVMAVIAILSAMLIPKIFDAINSARIEHAATTAPTSTRAHLRGAFVQAASSAGRDYTVDWVHLKVTGEESRTVLLKDPFRSADARVDELIGSLAMA